MNSSTSNRASTMSVGCTRTGARNESSTLNCKRTIGVDSVMRSRGCRRGSREVWLTSRRHLSYIQYIRVMNSKNTVTSVGYAEPFARCFLNFFFFQPQYLGESWASFIDGSLTRCLCVDS